MQKITPFLWFDNNALEAVHFYTNVFSNSAIVSTIPGPGGTVMGVSFQLNGQDFMALNGGPMFTFTEAISLYINCETQEEIDTLWNKLTSDGGKESRCGWLKDKYGLSWQLVPPVLGKLLADSDREKAGKVMQAMLQMNKLIIADLQKAYDE
jgi:predicted 3-demethylubiquinone-9 3-methyltransferase (glyoxalase superfamily)